MKSLVFLLVVFHYCHAFPHTENSQKIVGGYQVEIEQIPYQVAVLDVDQQICGGTIVSALWILTAAHCTDDTIPRYLTVRVGSSLHQQGGVIHQVDSVAQYPGHDPYGWLNDFALLHLDAPIQFSNIAQPVSLASSDADLDYEVDCTVSGWGKTLDETESSDQLRAASVKLVTREKCNQYYGGGVDEKMICAAERGHDSCQGDSGGPLVCDGKQVGIVSWGKGCAVEDYPGVYANVVFAREWIREVTGY